MSRGLTLILSLVISLGSLAQETDRYMVFFKNKANTPYSLHTPEEFLSEKAIQRDGRMVTEEDLPVTPSYVDQLEVNGAIIIGTSRWFNGALIELENDGLNTIEDLSFVENIEYVADGAIPSVGGRYSNTNKEGKTNETLAQNNLLSSDQMNIDGYNGQGIMIAVIDGGFSGVDRGAYFKHIYDDTRLIDAHNFVTGDVDVYDYSDHGTRVLSTIAASGDEYQGNATQAEYLLYVTEDSITEYRIEEYNWLLAAERADSVGADVITTSLGYSDFDDPSMDYTHADLDGNTAIITRAAEMAFARGIVVISSAGNAGNKAWQKVTPPADGEHVLTIGSVDEFEARSSFSALGPINGEWLKPDLMAMGSRAVLINDKGNIVTSNGTSFAAPQVAGLAAGIWSKYPDLSNVEIVNMLKESADRAGSPDFQYGYGIPSYIGFENLYNAVSKQNYFSVYPNPVIGDQIGIEIGNPNSGAHSIDVELYTADGKQLRQFSSSVSWRNNPMYIYLAGLSRGIYFLKMISAEHTEILRIVKQE